MKKVILFILLFVTAILLSNTQAQVENVGLDIQEIYEYYHGISLQQAIINLDKTKSLLDSNIAKDKPDSSKKLNKFCYSLGSDTTVIPVIPRKSLVKKDYSKSTAIRVYNDGIRVVRAIMIFEGDLNELEDLGVKMGRFNYGYSRISVTFPLEILPEVSKVRGVKSIYVPSGYEIL